MENNRLKLCKKENDVKTEKVREKEKEHVSINN